MIEKREFFVPNDRYQELSAADRERLASHAEERVWYVRRSTGTTHLYVKAKPGCPPEVIAWLEELALKPPRGG